MTSQDRPTIDVAIDILRATHDGDELTETELKIVEMGANNHLNARGKIALSKLLDDTARQRQPGE